MQVTGPAYSHDGNWIAFGEADHTPGGDQLSIVVLNLTDGTRRVVARNVVGGSPFKEFGRPRWSSDDKQIGFFIASWADPEAETPESTSLAIVSVDGSDVDDPRIIASLPDFASYPDWSPLEDTLLFDTYDEAWFHGKPSAIYSSKPDGTDLVRLTPIGVVAVHPTYSPDGRQILYTTFGDDGWPRLSLMNADGSGPVVLDVKGMHPRLQP
jgi:Tol biopolymer transport system component